MIHVETQDDQVRPHFLHLRVGMCRGLDEDDVVVPGVEQCLEQFEHLVATIHDHDLLRRP